jgi:hypothetical protein
MTATALRIVDGQRELNDAQRAVVHDFWRAVLLRALHPDGYRDLRALRSGAEPITISVSAANLESVAEFAESCPTGTFTSAWRHGRPVAARRTTASPCTRSSPTSTSRTRPRLRSERRSLRSTARRVRSWQAVAVYMSTGS